MVNFLYYAVIIATFVFFVLTFFIVYFAVLQNKRKLLFKQELLRAEVEIKESTLRYVAFELHDNLGQAASLIKINLNTIPMTDPELAGRRIEDTKEMVRQLIADIKALSVGLSGERVLRMGFVQSLENEIQRLRRTGHLDVSLTVDSGVNLVDPNRSLILYRMSQEILNNAVKHSQAARMEITVNIVSDFLTLVFADDGVGFNVDGTGSQGSGILNLRSRAELISAKLSIQSEPGHGTTVSIQLPLQK